MQDIKRLTAAQFRADAKAGGAPAPASGVLVCKALPVKIEAAEQTGETIRLTFVISTGEVDRQRDTIAPEGWDLKSYKKNPVVLWCHDYMGLPVAKALKTWIEDKKLKSIQEFASPDLYEFGYLVGRMYKEGFLSAQSVGFNPSEWAFVEDSDRPWGIDYKAQELLETSAVPVPANPGALIEARSMGLDTKPMLDWAERVLEIGKVEGHAELRATPGGMVFGTNFLEAVRRNADPISRMIVTFPGKTDAPETIEISEPSPDALEITDSPSQEAPADTGGAPETPAESTPAEAEAAPAEAAETPSGGETGSTPAQAEAADAPDPAGAAPSQDAPPAEEVELTLDLEAMDGPLSYEAAHPQGCAVAARGTKLRTPAGAETFGANHSAVGLKSGLYQTLIHHSPDGAAVWDGLVTAMFALAGGAPGLTVPPDQRRGVYDHLAKHYLEDFDAAPPEFPLIEAQILCTMGAQFKLNSDTGAIEPRGADEIQQAKIENACDTITRAVDAIPAKLWNDAGLNETRRDLISSITAARSGAKAAPGAESDSAGSCIEIIDGDPAAVDVDPDALAKSVHAAVADAVPNAIRAGIDRLRGRVE